MSSFGRLRGRSGHWTYVVLTAALAVAVAIWAIPRLGDLYLNGMYVGTPGDPPLPSLSPDLLLFPMSAQIALLAVGIGLLVQVYSTAYLGHHRRYRSYALVIVLFLVAMLAVVGTSNLWVLLVGWEVMGLCSYLLIGHEWETGEARAGAAKAFLVTRVADLGLVLAILVIGQTYGTYDLIGAEVLAGEEPRASTAIGLLVLVAVMGKSAQFPLHTWLPDAMPGPTPITALIHAATMVAAGVYLAARLLPLYADSQVAVTAMAVVAGITMLLGALLALVQVDLKRALAWSTVSQLALMLAAVAAGDPEAGTDHLVAHGVFKALLFLGCGCVMHAVGTSALSAAGGLRRVMPVTFVTMTIGFAALAGIVPTVGFFTKDSMLHAVWAARDGDHGLAVPTAYVLLAAALATTLLTAAYATRLWIRVFLAPATHDQHAHEAPRAMTGPLVVLAVATFVLSVGQPLHWGMGVVSTLVALAGVGLVVWRWRSGSTLDWTTPALAGELGIDRAYDHWIPSVARLASRAVVAADAEVVDAYPRGAATGSDRLSHLLGLVQSRNVQRYATVIAVGVVVLVVAGVVWS